MNGARLRWTRPPGRAEIGTQETDVWCFATDDPALDDAALGKVLSPDELDRAGRFLAAADRRSFVVGRAQLRTLLGRYLDADPRGLAFVNAESGKPRLDGGAAAPDLRFNVSGSGEIVLVAVRRLHDVGVDVERLAAIDETAAASAMTTREMAQWRSLEGPERAERFTALWAGKEAVAKAVGAGLRLSFADIELPAHPGCVRIAAIPVSVSPLPPPRRGYEAALASVAPFGSIRLWSTRGAG